MRDIREGETRFKRVTAASFYRAFNRISEVKVPLDVGDFRLVDRRVLDVFARMRESNRFVRGMFSWIGLPADRRPLPAPRALRRRDEVPAAQDAALRRDRRDQLLVAPLRVALNLGFIVSVVSFALAIWSLIVKFAGLYHVPGWTSIVVVTTFIGGVQLIVLGVIGEYIGDIHEEVKRRPLYVVGELENFPELPTVPRARSSPTGVCANRPRLTRRRGA